MVYRYKKKSGEGKPCNVSTRDPGAYKDRAIQGKMLRIQDKKKKGKK